VASPAPFARYSAGKPNGKRIETLLDLLVAIKEKMRLATAGLRVAPSFLIIGAQKAGTSSLFNYLCQHETVLKAIRKEVHFFDSPSYTMGERWYRSTFPRRWKLRDYLGGRRRPSYVSGDASPYYLVHPASPERAQLFDPQLKLIVMLRDPIERALSHYNHQIRQGNETLSFEDALAAEPDRLLGEREKMIDDPNYYSHNYWAYSYVERGLYAKHIQHWLGHFDITQFLFIRSDAFFQEPQNSYRQTLEFLDLEPRPLLDATRKNSGHYSKMGAPMRDHLSAVFREPNLQLTRLLGPKFDWGTNTNPVSGLSQQNQSETEKVINP